MKIRNLYLPALLILVSAASLFAQSGALKGKVYDKAKNEPIPFANVVVELNGTNVGGATTDFDGYYTIKPIPPGKYTIKATYVGYSPVQINGIIVSSDNITAKDIAMDNSAVDLGVVIVTESKGPELIDPTKTTSGDTKTREDIVNSPTRSITSIASNTAGVNQRDDGGALNIKGARSDATFYYIDGVKVRGSSNLPKQGIEQITVITGGIPAQYGDATGGIINVTTREPSKSFNGGAELVSSELFDKYGYNVGGLNFSGPLLVKYDTTLKSTRPVLDYFISAEVNHIKDDDPSAVGNWKVKDAKMKELENNPLLTSPTGTGFVYNTEFVTSNDLEKIKYRQNVAAKGVVMNGKFKFQPNLNTLFMVGGSYEYNTRHSYIYEYALFNPNNNPQTIGTTWRVFGRFTQKFGNTAQTDKNKSSSAIKNAFYQIQMDYEKAKAKTQDDSHKDRIFEYGYIGKFNTYKEKTYDYKTIVIDGKNYTGWIHNGYADTLLTYDASSGTYNPIASKYTAQAYDLNPMGFVSDIYLVNARGLTNGTRSDNVYGLWYNTGREYNGYSYYDNDQFRVTASGSADIKNHALVVGFEYEQRTERSYGISPVGLWGLMRQLANQRNTQLDTAHPNLVYQDYFGDGDTVNYNRLYTPGQTTGFYENVRKALGVSNTDWVDIDSYSPDQIKMNMFTADELYNNGSAYVAYHGYDYLGNKLKNRPSFDDYFNKKDANGNYTRDIAAFSPIYVAGYIQDKFYFKDLAFNVGVRVDRFDANQKVLKDKYLIYEAKTVSEVDATLNPTGAHPSNIGEDYVVYVNDKTFPTSIVGYRNGNKWYNYQGEEVTDPATIAKSTTTGTIVPYLVDSKQKTVTPGAFEDYKPQTTIMPRVAFSFPISTEALFFAHYDVLTQRPPEALRMDPTDFYFLEQTVSPVIQNPNLKPQKTTDYELGFKQRLTKGSALTLSAFYREMRDMVTLTNVNYAYPKSYQTYDNLDFGTVKGFIMAYDLRRLGNARISANYTLQFADGTGSASTTGANVIASGKPNLRIPIPLDFDQRHNIAVNFDYSYGSGKGDDTYNGPKWFGKNVFASTGANLIVKASSGYPYTRQSNVTQDGAMGLSLTRNLTGSINGSRLPWQYRMDLRLYKDIDMVLRKKSENKRSASVQLYLQIQNLLNTKNIMSVYRSTGNANDDGYLGDANSQTIIQSQINAQAFRDLYTIKINNPANYSLPRRMNLGVLFSF